MFKDICRVYKTIIEMLIDRNYDCNSYKKELSIDDVKNNFINNDSDIIVNHKKDENKRLLVTFLINDKDCGVKKINDLIDYLKEIEIKNVMLIVPKKLTSFGLKKIKSTSINYEIFNIKSLMINITKHILVPKHVLLSIDEKNKVLKSFKCNIEQLPKILKTDPVAKYYNAKIGQVFKIYRKDEIVYRCVV